MKKSPPSGRRIGVICLLAVLVALPAIVMGPLRQSNDSSADAASAEEAGPQIRRLYLASFEREPDPGGFAHWVGFRTRGKSLEWVADRFVVSGEFRGLYGENLSNREFVRLLYRNVLDREPDEGGFNVWTAALRSGRGRGWLLMRFSESAEFQRNTPPATSGPAATTTTTAPPTTTPPATTPPATTPPTTTPPATTPPPPPSGQAGGTGNGGLASIPSTVGAGQFLHNVSIPQDMSWEPSGNFRTFCNPSHLAYDDPIVYPGRPGASHLHQFFGNTGVTGNSTYASLRTSGDSTCEGGLMNRTGYWTPAMFDGSGNVIPPSFVLVYYKGTGTGGVASAQEGIRQIKTFPNGLRMVAGNPQGGAYWRCEGGSGQGSTIPNGCPQGQSLLGVVEFPMCWDGKNLDSADHRSHMSYKVRDNHTGRHECPASHPVHLPEITETFYYPWGGDMGSWYLSSDRAGMLNPAPDGSTLHADWFGAWDNAIQDRLIQNCIIGMRNGNSGDLCDGQSLTDARGGMGRSRVPGYRPSL